MNATRTDGPEPNLPDEHSTVLDPDRRARLVDSLVERHGDRLPRSTVEEAVIEAWAAFDGAVIRAYGEVLVRRDADERLKRLVS